MDARRLDPRTRALAWLWTGPIGHLYGGLVDWCSVAGRIALARARERRRGRRPGAR